MMDTARSLVAVVLCIGLLRSVDAQCSQENTQEFQECMTSYSTFMQNGDTSVMCSAESIAAMQCVARVASECPDLAQGAGQTVTTIQNMAGQCAVINGGGGGAGGGGAGGGMSPACMQIQECSKSMAGMGGTQPPAGNSGGNMGPTGMVDLSSMQTMIAMSCGPMKEMFDCIARVSGDCPQITDALKQNMGSDPTMPGMTYEKTTAFIKKSCSSMPKDFGNNTCVKDKFQAANNDDCVKKASEGVENPTCSDVGNVVGCLSLDDCGSKYDMTVREVIGTMFSAAQNKECDLTSDSYRLRASIFTIIAAVLLLIRLI